METTSVATLPATSSDSKQQALLDALRQGEVDKINKYLSDGGVDINRGRPPICTAITLHQYEVVKSLIAANCDLNVKDFDGGTPLCLAIRSEFLDICDILITSGRCDLDICDLKFKPPIIMATERKLTGVIQLLIEAGCDINQQDEKGFTALHVATNKNDHSTMLSLISAGCLLNVQNKKGFCPIHCAAALLDPISVGILAGVGHYIEMVEAMNDGPLPKHNEKVYRKCEVDKIISTAGNMTALQCAVFQGSKEKTASKNSIEVAKILLEHSQEPIEKVICVPIVYQRIGNLEMLDILLDHIDINGQFKFNPNNLEEMTLLTLAIKYNKKKAVEILLARDADPLKSHEKGQSTLYKLVKGMGLDSGEILVMLLEHIKANAQLRGDFHPKKKMGPFVRFLHLFSRMASDTTTHLSQIFKLVYELGFDINLPLTGKSPLIIALENPVFIPETGTTNVNVIREMMEQYPGDIEHEYIKLSGTRDIDPSNTIRVLLESGSCFRKLEALKLLFHNGAAGCLDNTSLLYSFILCSYRSKYNINQCIKLASFLHSWGCNFSIFNEGTDLRMISAYIDEEPDNNNVDAEMIADIDEDGAIEDDIVQNDILPLQGDVRGENEIWLKNKKMYGRTPIRSNLSVIKSVKEQFKEACSVWLDAEVRYLCTNKRYLRLVNHLAELTKEPHSLFVQSCVAVRREFHVRKIPFRKMLDLDLPKHIMDSLLFSDESIDLN